MTPALALENIECTFASRENPAQRYTAVRDTTLVIREGEFVSLVGPTGCGKSTLLNVEAKKTGYLFTFAVVDPSGELVYFEKMDGAPTASNDIGIGKAWTAATFKRPSKAFFDGMESGHSFFGQLHPRVTASAGGIPLMVSGKIVGAIGVSGGANGLMDNGAAQAGADALK